MANLLGQNIGTNYKGILNLDTINTPLDATLRAVTDGEGNASPLQLSTTAVSLGGATGANWDNTNKRLGIGTNAPISSLTINASGTWVQGFNSNLRLNGNSPSLQLKTDSGNGGFMIATSGSITYFSISANSTFTTQSYIGNIAAAGNWNFGTSSNLSATVGIKGSGSTSATTALLVQNSAGTNTFKVLDSGAATLSGAFSAGNVSTTYLVTGGMIVGNGQPRIYSSNALNANLSVNTTGIVASTSSYSASNASAVLEATSTTQGFLPPRMTTTQKNAIATPASGLIVYDSTTNKLACYNGTTWNDLF